MSHSAGNLSSNPARNPQKTLKFCNRFHFLFSPTVPSPTWNDRGGFVPRCFVQTIPRNPKKPAICTLFAFLVYALGTVPLNTRNYQVQVVQQPEQQPGHQRPAAGRSLCTNPTKEHAAKSLFDPHKCAKYPSVKIRLTCLTPALPGTARAPRAVRGAGGRCAGGAKLACQFPIHYP